MASYSFESDSCEQVSTTDDVESSHQWTTDFEDDSEPEENDRTDSNDEDSDQSKRLSKKLSINSTAKKNFIVNKKKKLMKENEKKKLITDNHIEKSHAQSDTETRNLLDDIGDFDEDYLDLQEAESLCNNNASHHSTDFLATLDAAAFDLSEEQYNYYTKCFLYMLEKTQGHMQVNGALNGADFNVIQFFQKSQLDNKKLSKIWALADVNQDGFLNLVEFIVAVHLIVLHIKGNIPIPENLPLSTRPPSTPKRQLLRLSNGCFVTVYKNFTNSQHNEEQFSAVSSSSVSNSSLQNSTNIADFLTAVDVGTTNSNNLSSSLNISQPYYTNKHKELNNFNSNNQLQWVNQQQINKLMQNECQNLLQYSTNQLNTTNSLRQNSYVAYTDLTDLCINNVKQHSLSDDHLHLHAQREVEMAKFSDVPPVLVDSHPTALNAAFNSQVGLTALESTTLFRGPPPKPPCRDYVNNNKGHGRSASLDLKTFSTLVSPLKPLYKDTSNKFYTLQLENTQSDVLNDNFWQYYLPSKKNNQSINVAKKEQSTQTYFFEKSEQLDYEDFFLTNILYEHLSNKERCTVLTKLNDELENERIKLAQIRLQLQLRIDELQEYFYDLSVSQQITSENLNKNVNVQSPLLKPTSL